MFRLIAAIAMIMMPIVSAVSTDDRQAPIRSHDIFVNEGCPAAGCDSEDPPRPFTDGGTKVNQNR